MNFQDNAGACSLGRFLSPEQVRQLTGLSAATLWRMRRRGELPEPVQLSPGRVAWRETDIEAWIAARPTARRGNNAARIA